MTNNKDKRKGPLHDLLPILIGEIVVVALVCAGFAIAELCDLYHTDFFKVVIGALLGAIIILANHLWLSLTVDREIRKYLEIRGSRQMDEEEIESFTKQHSAAIQKAMASSTVIRTGAMLAMLVLAFITGWFNPIATAIPMFALRPILSVAELIRSKNAPQPDPAKFIKYDNEEKKEKEDS